MRFLEYINLNESSYGITNDIDLLSDGDFKNAYKSLYNWLLHAEGKYNGTDGKLRLIDCITDYKIINRPNNFIEITGSNKYSYYIGVKEDKNGIKFWCTTLPEGTSYTETQIQNSKKEYDRAKDAVKCISEYIL